MCKDDMIWTCEFDISTKRCVTNDSFATHSFSREYGFNSTRFINHSISSRWTWYVDTYLRTQRAGSQDRRCKKEELNPIKGKMVDARDMVRQIDANRRLEWHETDVLNGILRNFISGNKIVSGLRWFIVSYQDENRINLMRSCSY